ncbi:MAG: response regulator transcription factor [Actinomycetia bacterium]|nr:response regulator transcription factor [Actinomycetes bacterium]
MIRVLLADDDGLVRAGMSMIAETTDDITVVGEAATGSEAVEMAARLEPDVILMDIQMPGGDGIEATRRILERPGCEARVIVVTTFELDKYVFESLRAGASGYLLKRSRPAELIDGIRVVAAGEALLSPSVTRRLVEEFAEHLVTPADVDQRRVDALTQREGEVLACVARGLSNAEIAAEMHISESTAKTHLKRVLMKLGLRDRVGAVVFAYETGFVRPGSHSDDG